MEGSPHTRGLLCMASPPGPQMGVLQLARTALHIGYSNHYRYVYMYVHTNVQFST